ncbi:MAG: zeta toxin family protein [Stenotrophobium sp.]
MSARIVVLAGVNGAGKSSVAGEAIRSSSGEFFNPDSAAGVLYDGNPGMSREQANAQAWDLGRRGLERALANGEFFAFETTLGANTIPAMLLAGADQGAEIHVSYVGLASPELHIQRVNSRVAAGGHDIPEKKIRERYVTSRENLIRLMPHLTSLRIYDNSAESDPKRRGCPAPLLLLQMSGGRIVQHVPLDQVPAWAKPLLAAALRQGKARRKRRSSFKERGAREF